MANNIQKVVQIWKGLKRAKATVLRALPTHRYCNTYNFLCSIVIFYFLIAFGSLVSDERQVHPNEIPSKADQDHILQKEWIAATTVPQDSKPKTILFWTPYYNRSDFSLGFGQDPFTRGGCKVTNCIATADRNLINQSDAVIFHAFQVNIKDLPKERNPQQKFIFFLYETIPNTSIPCIGKCLPEKQYIPHYFNWTMTHRRDSDIYVAKEYGAIVPNYQTLPAQLPDELPSGTLPLDPSVLLNRQYPQLANKTKMVAWFASHCPTHSQREDYVKELSKFVQVDVYGKCGTMECLPRNSHRCNSVLDTYKFYLAAENSLCPDYISEKFYRALMNGIVPIVYGGADYTDYAPPHSFINIANFKSPKDLAEYLTLLNKNDALYMEYLQWRKHYTVVKTPMKGWCDLCAKLNDPAQETKTKTYKDIASWWIRDFPCYPGSSFLKNHL